MKENIIKVKSFDFALDIIKLYRFLNDEKREYILSKQVMKSGTSIGAMVRESEHAESKSDFIHKLAIAQKEANETAYWLELLFRSGYIGEIQYRDIVKGLDEIQKILASIILTSKGNNKRPGIS